MTRTRSNIISPFAGCSFATSLLTTTTIMLLLLLLLSLSATTTEAAFRMWPVGDGADVIEWATQFVWNPDNETMVFSTNCVSNKCKLWQWNPRTETSNWIAYSGVWGWTAGPHGDGKVAQFKGSFGITLAISPETGFIIGYLMSQNAAHYIDKIDAYWPHGVVTAAGDGLATAAPAGDGTGSACKLNAPVSMNYHRRWRKMFLAGQSDNKVRLLEWVTASNALKCTTLAGTGTLGYLDHATSSKDGQCDRPWSVAPAPLSGAQPTALFFSERALVRVRRITPVSPTGALTTVFSIAGSTNFGRNLDIIEMPDGEFRMLLMSTVNTGELYHFKFVSSTITTGGSIGGATNQWVNTLHTAPVTTATDWAGAIPNGTLVVLQGANPTVRVWQRADFFAGSLTKSRSITRCNTNPAEIDTTTTFPAGTIAPITDSIFDFKSFTPLCCADITPNSFVTTCKSTLNTCTGSATGVTLVSTKYLLDGSFATEANAYTWARSCVKDYLACMRNGAAAATLTEHPLCTWASDAKNKLSDPSECEVFVSAAMVGMARPAIISTISPELCSGTFATVAPSSSPFGSTDSDIVARIPTCGASSGWRCQRTYQGGGDCTCPATTTSQDIPVLTAISALRADHWAVNALPSSAASCVNDEAIISICTSHNDPNEFVSSFTRDALTANAGGTKYYIGGSCVQQNPKTGYCACPYNNSAFEYVIPVLVSGGFYRKRILTFCMPRGTATFFKAALNWEPSLSSQACVHPFGTNFSCDCTAYATRRIVPASVYPTRTAVAPIPGSITFCDSDQVFPDEVDPKVVAGVIGITIVGGITGGSMQGLQAAALTMTMCADNKSTDGARKMLTFASIDAAGQAKGLAFLAMLGIVIVFAQWLAAVLYMCVLMIFNAPHEDFETGEGLPEGETPGFCDRWEAACIKVRYPHWAVMMLRVVFPGFMMEAAAVLRTREMPYTAIGGVAVLAGVIYCLVVFYKSFFALRDYAGEEMIMTTGPPDEDQEYEDNNSNSNNNASTGSALENNSATGGKYGAAGDSLGGGGPAQPRQVYVQSKATDSDGDSNSVEEMADATTAGAAGGASHVETAQNADDSIIHNNHSNSATMMNSSRPKTRAELNQLKPSEIPDPGDGDYVQSRLGADGDFRLPPSFLWYTQKGSLHQFPMCLNWCYVPRGWWTKRRFYARRFASFFNMFLPRATRWMPTFLQCFMLTLGCLTASEGCEIPMSIVGVLNFGAAAVYMFLYPCRRPLENALMGLQFALTGILAIARGQERDEVIYIFMAVFAVAVVQMFHIGSIEMLEVMYIYDKELERFHDPAKLSEENTKRALSKKYETVDQIDSMDT